MPVVVIGVFVAAVGCSDSSCMAWAWAARRPPSRDAEGRDRRCTGFDDWLRGVATMRRSLHPGQGTAGALSPRRRRPGGNHRQRQSADSNQRPPARRRDRGDDAETGDHRQRDPDHRMGGSCPRVLRSRHGHHATNIDAGRAMSLPASNEGAVEGAWEMVWVNRTTSPNSHQRKGPGIRVIPRFSDPLL